MSFYYNITEHFHFRECAFLQSSDDVATFEAEIQKCGSNETYLDQAVSNYDFTDEMPEEPTKTFGQIWIRSFKDYFETFHYLVISDIFGNYAIYRKAWL